MSSSNNEKENLKAGHPPAGMLKQVLTNCCITKQKLLIASM